MKILQGLGIFVIIASFIFSCWLSIGWMLIGGINTAITGFNTGDTALGVWSIIRAFFFEMGFLPFWIGWITGIELIFKGLN